MTDHIPHDALAAQPPAAPVEPAYRRKSWFDSDPSADNPPVQRSSADSALRECLAAVLLSMWKEGKSPLNIVDAFLARLPTNQPQEVPVTAEIASIVARLRNFAVWNNSHSHYEPVPLCKEAADLIERTLRRTV